ADGRRRSTPGTVTVAAGRSPRERSTNSGRWRGPAGPAGPRAGPAPGDVAAAVLRPVPAVSLVRRVLRLRRAGLVAAGRLRPGRPELRDLRVRLARPGPPQSGPAPGGQRCPALSDRAAGAAERPRLPGRPPAPPRALPSRRRHRGRRRATVVAGGPGGGGRLPVPHLVVGREKCQ